MSNELQALYQEVILDHGRSPRNFRHPDDANCFAHGRNPMCGDVVTVFLRVTPSGVVEDVSFVGKGCAISMASASLMTEVLRGKSVIDAEQVFEAFHRLCTQDGADLVEVEALSADDAERLEVFTGVRQFPIRVKCATLPWHAMHAALRGEEEATSE
jgi:nitrogen fixation protein NifU and related proteins